MVRTCCGRPSLVDGEMLIWNVRSLPGHRCEMQVLRDAVDSAPHYAELLMHLLNRREVVDSSQIEGTYPIRLENLVNVRPASI